MIRCVRNEQDDIINQTSGKKKGNAVITKQNMIRLFQNKQEPKEDGK